MNTSPFWPLVWKEYRVGRGFWLAMASMGLVAQVGVYGLAHQPASRDWWLYGIALMISAGFAVGMGGTLFAIEHEERTIALLRRMPLRAGQLGAAKILSALAGLAALLAVLWFAASAMTGWQSLPTTEVKLLWRLWGLACLEGLAWGILYSLAIRSPLYATLAAALTVALFDSFIVLFTNYKLNDFTVSAYAETVPCRTALLLLVVVADAILLPCWLAGRLPKRQSLRLRLQRATPNWWRPFTRLAWQTLREGLTSFLLLVVAVLLALGLSSRLREALSRSFNFAASGGIGCTDGSAQAARIGWPINFALPAGVTDLSSITMLLALIAAIEGALVFHADQLHGPRFLAERGASPRTIWFSRQLVWGAWLWGLIALSAGAFLVSLGVGLIRWAADDGLIPTEMAYRRELILGSMLSFIFTTLPMWLMLLPAYAAGQLASLLLRRGLLSVTFGLVLGVLTTVWVWLMHKIGAAWWWSVLPLPIGMLLATWLRMPAWLVERSGWRSWVAPSAAALLPVATLLVAVPTWRVTQIPASKLELPLPSSSPAAIEDARVTLGLYAKAWELQQASHQPLPEGDASQGDKAALITEYEARVQPVVDLVLAASRRESDLLVLPVVERRAAATRIEELTHLLVLFAYEQTQTGKLDRALDAYLAVWRLRMQIDECNGSRPPIPRETFDGLQAWAGAPGQTTERIRAAIERVKQCHATLPGPASWMVPEYEETALTITNLETAVNAQIVPSTMLSQDNWLFSQLVWERARARRLLDWLTNWQLVRLQITVEAIAEGRPVRPVTQSDPHTRSWPDVAQYYSRFASWLLTTPLLAHCPLITQSMAQVAVFQETEYRATIIIMALEAWKAEHGQLPERLEELVGSELDTLPLDPLWGRPFLYYPHGFVGFTAPGADSTGVIQPGADLPFLWSASTQKFGSPVERFGPLVFAAFFDDVTQPVSPRPPSLPIDTEGFPYCRNNSSGQPVLSSVVDVLREGHPYYIPQAEENLP